VLRRSAGYLGERGSSSPRLDADLLLAHALGVDRLTLYTDHERPLTPPELAAMRALIGRRGKREPLAHLVGTRAFRRLTLAVSPQVLVPRPETELLVEWALELLRPGARVADWGTGSGAVALALADEGPEGVAVTALERSPAALAVARANAALVAAEVEWLESDGFAAVAGRRFDLVVANPPYLSQAELDAAPPELTYEPRDALVAGPLGTEALARLAAEAPAHLEPGAWLLSEIGAGQGEAAAAIWREAGFADVEVRPDLAGLPRVVGGTVPR
jgi:release factor glutamine methyltransferase